MSTSEINPFDQNRVEGFDQLIENNSVANPVDKEEFFDALDQLEYVGQGKIAEKVITLAQFAETMQSAFAKAEDVYVEPPLDKQDQDEMTRKLAVFDAIVESTKPQEKPAKPTSTSKIKTNSRKS